MYLKSITLKGFKSFPDRTGLEFGPGVSVIVGPNGSGKSNVTDAVLWALGEQSPVAVRGQTMQDMVFAGGHGVKGRSSAEVEIVIDNSSGRLQSEFSEIAISRYVDRSGDGVYRLNGARCRLVDLLEVLSDSGLGKEMHSVISQGKVEAIVHSKPEDRTAMVEEAAGLTKHRRRRRRAQLKLARTQDNLDRALDVEREARSHLRPLKRQAEAAELHARLERQSFEARAALLGDDLVALREELVETERSAAAARERRDAHERELLAVAQAREEAERSFAEHGRAREALAGRLFAARSAGERLEIRLESAEQALERIRARLARTERSLAAPETVPNAPGGSQERLTELEEELARLDRERESRLTAELAQVEAERMEAERAGAELATRITETGSRLDEAASAAHAAVERGRELHRRGQEQARREAQLDLELEAIAERLRLAAERSRWAGGRLVDRIEVDAGYEAALAAALGGRLGARVVETVAEAAAAVEGDGDGSGRAILKAPGKPTPTSGGARPDSGVERLRDHVRPAPDVSALVDRLLERAWLVERIADIPDGFTGIAVTRDGIAYDGELGEVWRAPEGGAERTIAERAKRDDLNEALERAKEERRRLREEQDRATVAARDAEERRDILETELRDLRRRASEAVEIARRCTWLVEQRRGQVFGPEDARRAELSSEIAVERRLAERLAQEREEAAARRRHLESLLARDRALVPAAERLAAALAGARDAVAERRQALERELAADQTAGEEVAGRLRELAAREYELQAALREAAEALTHEEVRVAQARDRESLLAAELAAVIRRLGLEQESPTRLTDEERAEHGARLERVERRRERLGPVNPLAGREYEEAVAHVEELESQRKDLEAALAELQGLIRETDRMIRESFDETFDAAAKNFEDVIERLFPGGRGALRRVNVARRPRAVLGGEEDEPSADPAFGHRPAGQPNGEPSVGPSAALAAHGDCSDLESYGVEIEVTPAGKTTRRLSLLSGGEKSLVALAFMFAVFLARPCPFYILDEVEAALDDANIDRFLSLVRGYSDRAQFIIVTHQRRTMEAADVLYGVSMGKDGVSKVVSRRLANATEPAEEARAA
jgi:chromosome segregation protein